MTGEVCRARLHVSRRVTVFLKLFMVVFEEQLFTAITVVTVLKEHLLPKSKTTVDIT